MRNKKDTEFREAFYIIAGCFVAYHLYKLLVVLLPIWVKGNWCWSGC